MSTSAERIRGQGRATAGATSVTMAVYFALREAGEPGLLVDEVLERVRDRVPLGYAKRAYREHRESLRRSKGILSEPPRSIPSDYQALRFIVKKSLDNMTLPHRMSAIRRSDKRYVVGTRAPRLQDGTTLEQHDPDGSVTRKAVAMMEFLRVAEPIMGRVASRRAAQHNEPNRPLAVQAMADATQRLIEAYRR